MKRIELLQELVRRAPPSAAVQKKADEGIAKAVNAVLPGLALRDAHGMTSTGVKGLALHIQSMTSADLKRLLKAWDPHRKISQQQTTSELSEISIDLLNATTLPVPKPPPTPRKTARR